MYKARRGVIVVMIMSNHTDGDNDSKKHRGRVKGSIVVMFDSWDTTS